MSKAVRKDGKAGKAGKESQTLESNPGKKSGRDANGRFLPGVVANPKGRPPITVEMKVVRELAAAEREANVRELVRLRDNAEDPWVRLEAIKMLLNYSDGKPVSRHDGAPLVAVQFNNNGGMPIADAHTAAQVYESIMRDPTIDLGAIKFAPALIEQRPVLKETK